MSYPNILKHTAEAWEEISVAVFRAAWVVCGYFEPTDFDDAAGPDQIGLSTFDDAKHLLEPCGVLEGSTIIPTPQYCQTYDWRIQDLH